MEGDDYGDDDDDEAWTKSQESGEEAPGKSSLIREPEHSSVAKSSLQFPRIDTRK